MENLTQNNYDIRDVFDLFELVSFQKEKFFEKHGALISLSEDFINYFIDNFEDVFEIMHPQDIEQENKEEEDWECVETGPLETHNTLTTIEQKEEDWECVETVPLETHNTLTITEPKEEEYEGQYEWERVLEEIKVQCRIHKENYIIGLWKQSESDLKAADILQKNDCCTQAIFCYQQASEKALKALLLKSEVSGMGVYSDYYKSHYLDMLAERALTIQDKYDGNFELLKNARLFEAVGPDERRKRSLCVRARYAVTSISQENTQPWFVFHRKDVLNASKYTSYILNYCNQELGFEKLTCLSNCIIQ
jgi:HEPN domain-containing protein